nr:MAG TPA: hypothetical protein [Caudoviricetes sp.]
MFANLVTRGVEPRVMYLLTRTSTIYYRALGKFCLTPRQTIWR